MTALVRRSHGRIPRLRLKTAAPAFAPSDVAGLSLWLKGDAGTFQDAARTLAASADGDPVGGWEDQSSAAKHASQATAAKRFTLKTGANGINGRAVLRADGVDDYLETLALAALTNHTVFLAIRRNGAPTGYSHICGFGFTNFTAAGTQYAQYYAPAAGAFNANLVTAGLDIAALAVLNTSAGVWAYRKDDAGGGTGELWLDGTSQGTGTGNQVIVATAAFLAGWNGNHFNGDIAEVIVYDSPLSVANRQSVGTYLRDRWGTP